MKSLPLEVLNSNYRHKITEFIKELLSEKGQEFEKINSWGKDFNERLLEFIFQGKMIRGSLILFINEAYAGEVSKDAIRAASAMELFHSALLIHDDIMDRDTMRRGQQAIYAQYQNLGRKENIFEAERFGEGMGICAGDIIFFLGFQVLSSIEDNNLRQQIQSTSTQELMAVGLAQMQDVYAGYSKENPSEQDIDKVYLYKTGRYTFSLPMMLGTILSKQPLEVIKQYEKLGEYLGVLFQLKDDELSIYGRTEETGKPEGSDIRQNKKTLYRYHLFKKASPSQLTELNDIFGKENITPNQLSFVRNLINDLGIKKLLDDKMQDLQNKAKEIIMIISLQKRYKDNLLQLLMYISERSK